MLPRGPAKFVSGRGDPVKYAPFGGWNYRGHSTTFLRSLASSSHPPAIRLKPRRLQFKRAGLEHGQEVATNGRERTSFHGKATYVETRALQIPSKHPFPPDRGTMKPLCSEVSQLNCSSVVGRRRTRSDGPFGVLMTPRDKTCASVRHPTWSNGGWKRNVECNSGPAKSNTQTPMDGGAIGSSPAEKSGV